MSSVNYSSSNLLKRLVEGTTNSTEEYTQQLLKSGVQPLLYRVVILEVIFDPSVLDDARIQALSDLIAPNYDGDIRNLPRNTIVGQHVRSSKHVGESIELFFPFLPSHLGMPAKPGEHVWVIYEDPSIANRLGYWLWKISQPRNVDDPNYTHADRRFDPTTNPSLIDRASGTPLAPPGFPNGVIGDQSDGKFAVAETASLYGDDDIYDQLLTTTDASLVTDYEPVPRYKKRPGDLCLEGSNNTLIVLGTDRTGAPGTILPNETGSTIVGTPTPDKRGKAGVIDIVVGRGQEAETAAPTIVNSLQREETDKSLLLENPNEGNPDFASDSARIYVAMNTNADTNFAIDISASGGTTQIDKSPDGSTVTIKADQIRFVARQDFKFVVGEGIGGIDASSIVIKADTGDIIFIPGQRSVIKLGGESADRAILCTSVPADASDGTVKSSPIATSMGGLCGTNVANLGTFASKVLVKV